jgi:hypothetical protein
MAFEIIIDEDTEELDAVSESFLYIYIVHRKLPRDGIHAVPNGENAVAALVI